MKKDLPMPRIPVSTYRLQLNKAFGFTDVRRVIPYLHDLGITDIYVSPFFMAERGSTHGYDIVDHNRLNPEIGNEGDFDAMVQEFHKFDMGQILDIVPNHMYIESSENAQWMDVLENGPSAKYADFFDIDWDPVKPELRNKVLLPILGDQYGRVLDNQELQLLFDDGAFLLSYYDHRFPVIPKTYIPILEHDLDRLRERLSEEHPDFTELLSIITALNHLPAYTELDPEKVEERYREKEVIKRRLRDLYGRSSDIRSFIEDNVRKFNGVRGDQRSFELLDELLSFQVYRLSFWRVATEEINYRRFFDVNSLAAIRMENPEVFSRTHKMVMRFIRDGKITGLRVDHPDGLYDPSEYFRLLQRNCFFQLRPDYHGEPEAEVEGRSSPASAGERGYDSWYKPFYIVGEKILLKGERMPEEWPIFSTTGYVFLNSLNGIFVDTGKARAFDNIYEKFISEKMNFQDIVYEKKKLIMEVAMSSEVNTLGHYLNRISEKDRHTRDFTLNSLIHSLMEVIAFFPVYRTYINSYEVADRDRQYIDLAVSNAKRKNPAISDSIFEFVRDVLLLRGLENMEEADRQERLQFVMRFQQITGPVMAKGVEDTAFYVYNRFVSLNEVGGMPDRFGTPLETFHGQNIERAKSWPHAMIASSTHDTKRSEDVRARLNVLSEMPDEWRRHLLSWRRFNKKKRPIVDNQPVPDRNEEYLLYQTLVGAWPAGPLDEKGYEAFRQRIRDYIMKAIREAKVNTSWINPNSIYEEAVALFINRIMRDVPTNHFLQDLKTFQKKIAHYGMFNSLSQTLLKITSPGLPDFYQGMEIWSYSLVDPDNRRPVDYELRMNMLEDLKRREDKDGPVNLVGELLTDWQDGRIKMFITYKALNFRRDRREIFDDGDYIPVEATAPVTENVCAFARRSGKRNIIVAAPRLLAGLSPRDALPLGSDIWGKSSVVIPFVQEGRRYRNIFTGEELTTMRQNEAVVLPLAGIFCNTPVALLEMLP
jgi:(1->4)-alpha-D-glucan 1-alpha-D-glucosylmutase